jgi:anaerobic magnesium-protoporphyrin IX monomethyl ester cyclase
LKRILFVQAYNGREEFQRTIFPLGLCYIATALADKHDVKIFDPNLCGDNPYSELAEKIMDFKPDILALSIRNIDTCDKKDIFYYYKTVPVTIKLMKEKMPDATIVVGGSGFSIFAREIMDRIRDIDLGVYLEAEETFPELIEKLDRPQEVKGLYYRKDGEVLFTGLRPLPDFENLPMPRKDFVDMKRYPNPLFNVGIQTKRGCPLRCAHCSYPFLNGNKVRMRSPKKVVDEIEYHVKEFGVREFMFVDGVFNVPEKHAEEICNEIISRGIDVNWAAWCEIKHFSEEFLILARKAGCRTIGFSPDAMSDEALNLLGKDISSKDIEKAFRLIIKHRGVNANFGFFCTPPGQTIRGVFSTIYMYFKINALMLSKGGAAMGWIRIEPHTRMEQIALKEGYITKDMDLLPEKEEDLKALFYTSKPFWMADRLVESILWLVNSLVIPALKTIKILLRLLTPARSKERSDL